MHRRPFPQLWQYKTFGLFSQESLIVFMLPAQLETLPGNFCAQKFQSLFLVVCVMCVQGKTGTVGFQMGFPHEA